MQAEADAFTIGVEEEFFIVDQETRALRPRLEPILARARGALGDAVQPELQLIQVETGTPVCRSLAEVRRELARLRHQVMAAAVAEGTRICASGTHPFSHWNEGHAITPKPAYVALERDYQQLAREQLVCGCHVHVGFPDGEDAIEVLNRVGPWLSPIVALAVNSPFWAGVDTGYGSFRTEVWRRWPMAGLPHVFESRAEYDQLVRELVVTGSIDDPARIYWDVRPSAKFATLEFRATDICLTVDEAVLVAGLVRALAQSCHTEAVAGRPVPRVRPEMLRASMWRAARYGVEADLVDVLTPRAVPAREMVEELLAFLRPALADRGEWEEISGLARETAARGTGAARQRQAFARSGRMEDVVDLIVSETVRG
ncbi:MAG: carboxylate-amine ligase [Actinomycetota bacterium]|nr:carboxylate-amine ligase [Actinomycetota bacterium]